MPLSPKTDEDDEAITILLSRYNERLSAWEVEFIESIADREQFTEKQREVFERIWGRVMRC